ncbi:MAG: energy-coupling factor transporter transmembrane protein EcfT, partial [Malacoplasma sp.]|nr:energy-coupling factor transporter transmembrane protein EcfT [Malacoplasma sp.]
NALKDLIGNNPVSEGWSIKEVFYGTSETQQYVYIYLTKWYTYSSQAISLMIYVTLKIFLMILIVTILTSTTSSIQLTCALEDILNPFRYLRLPVAEWSMTIALVLRFIPSLLDESNRILKAQASRGLDFKNGNLKDKLFSLTSLVVPLFSIAFKKAGELSNAMEARGYNPRYSRTRYRDYDIKFWDWIIFSIAAFLFGVLITLVTLKGKQMFVSFGFWDIFAH